MKLNKEQIAILKFTENKVDYLYCGNSLDMQILLNLKLMRYAGKLPYVPDSYFTITKKGREILNEISK